MSQQSNKQTPKFLALTNKTLKVGSQIYQIRNITHVEIVKLKPKRIVTNKAIIVFLLIGILLKAVEIYNLRFLAYLSFSIASFGILESIRKKVSYGLILETNAAKNILFSSSDREFMQLLNTKIYEVMNNEDVPASYIFNMQDRSVNVGGSVGGDVISGDYQSYL